MIHTGTPPMHGRRHDGKRALRGFTLVELMVTIAVAAILMMIAVPSFKHITASTQLTTVSNSLVNALNTARMEAIKRNGSTQFCAGTSASNGTDTLGTACGSQLGAVYALVGASGAQTATPVLAAASSVASAMHFSNMVAVQYNAQGLAHKVGAGTTSLYAGPLVTVCSTAIETDNQRIVSMVAGSIIATASSTGACP